MAKVQLLAGFKSTFFEKFEKRSAVLKDVASPTSFAIVNADQGISQQFEGSFELTQTGRVKSGTITSFSTFYGDQVAWTVSELSLSIDSYNKLFIGSKQSSFDLLFGGADNFIGSSDPDTIFSYGGSDAIYGNSGNDFIDAGDDSDLLFGDNGDDALLGSAGEDQLNGGLGSDLLDGGTEADLLTGGLGENTFVTRIGASPEFTSFSFDANSDALILDAANGVDLITDFKSGDVISSQDGNYFLPTSTDLSQGFFKSGNGIFVAGNWSLDTGSSGLNRGTFEITFNGPDILFFIALPTFTDFYGPNSDLIPVSDFGSQLFILDDANPGYLAF